MAGQRGPVVLLDAIWFSSEMPPADWNLDLQMSQVLAVCAATAWETRGAVADSRGLRGAATPFVNREVAVAVRQAGRCRAHGADGMTPVRQSIVRGGRPAAAAIDQYVVAGLVLQRVD